MKCIIYSVFLIANCAQLARSQSLIFVKTQRDQVFFNHNSYLTDLETALFNICKARDASGRFRSAFSYEIWNMNDSHEKKRVLMNKYGFAYSLEIRTRYIAGTLDVSLHLYKIGEGKITDEPITSVQLNVNQQQSVDGFSKWLSKLNEEIRLSIEGKSRPPLEVEKFKIDPDIDPDDGKRYATYIPKSIVEKFDELKFNEFKITYCPTESESEWIISGKIISMRADTMVLEVSIWKPPTPIHKEPNFILFSSGPSYHRSAKNLAYLLRNHIMATFRP